MKKWMIILIVVGIVILSLVATVVGTYNTIVTYDEQTKQAWAQVDNVLQRRMDLIPNLVNTVKGYAAHENEVFTKVTEARAGMLNAKTPETKLAANDQLTAALSRLMLVVENYPNLKANENFMALQNELAGTENRISVERKRYNESIQAYNTYIRQFKGRVIGGILGYGPKAEYFKAQEGADKAPEVKF